VYRLVRLLFGAFLCVGGLPFAHAADTATATSNEVAGANSNSLPNFHKVTAALYRGAQPEPAGYAELKRLGIRTVVNLRTAHADRDLAAKAGLNYEEIPMKAWHPEGEDIVRFLRIAGDTNLTPVFVHCHYGADRTGTMCAIYRIFACGWKKPEAVREMIDGGFGFHPVWKDLVDYVRNLDTEAIHRKLSEARVTFPAAQP
jgi:protein tyrosine/serine phosphatase